VPQHPGYKTTDPEHQRPHPADTIAESGKE